MFGLGINKLGASVGRPVSPYAVLGFKPNLILDFIRGYYKGVGNVTPAVTASGTSNATMVDTDGLIKWRPHNLLSYSEDFTDAYWSKQTGTTVTANQTASPAGTLTADLVTSDGTKGIFKILAGIAPRKNTRSVWLKGVSGGETVLLKDPNLTVGTLTCNLTTDWQLFTQTENARADANALGIWVDDIPAGGIYIWGAQLNRSDLGGMVNNPARGDSYVPTVATAVYLPRQGQHIYDGASWVNKGLLHESEARTNLVTYSSEFDNAAWTKGRSTITSNSTVSPDGFMSGGLLVEDTSVSNTHDLRVPLFTFTLGIAYTISVYAKAFTTNRNLYIRLGNSNSDSAKFNLQTGSVISAESDATATMQSAGDGWYRCTVSSSAVTTGSQQSTFYIMDENDSFVYTGDGTSGIYIWGAQVEEGSTPSSYIPTSGATATRAADVLTIPAANMPWPQPQVIGPELVTNGTFDTDLSGWNTGASPDIVWDNGKMQFSDANVQAFQNQTLTSGSVFVLTIDYDVNTAASIRVNVDNVLKIVATSGSGTYQLVFAGGYNAIRLYGYCGAGESCTVDNVSIREINPLSVSIQMDGLMTYADEGSTSVLWFDWKKR